MLQLTGKTDEEIIKLFNISTNQYNSLNFNLFINQKIYKQHSIVDVLYYLQDCVKSSKIKKLNKRLTNSLNINLALDFFEKLDLKHLVEPIIYGLHPMFETIIDKNSFSSVGHKSNCNKMYFKVGDTGTINGLINLVHECSHAINGFCANSQQLLMQENNVKNIYGENSNEYKAESKNYDNFLKDQSSFAKDCCKEIESSIIELLMLDFLEKRNTISPEDKNLYLNIRNYSLGNHIQLMITEDIIYSTIIEIKRQNNSTNNNMSQYEFNELKLRLQSKQHYNIVLDKVYDIALNVEKRNHQKNSRYRFRYIVGEIFSTVWFDKYTKSNNKEKQQMINNYKSFLFNNHNHDLKTSLSLLLPDYNFETLIKDFKSIITSKTDNLII